MTAKEIADKLIREHALDGDFACLDDYKYLFEKIAKEYAKQKCKEQRELCASAKGRVVSEIKIENGDLIQKGIYRKKTEEDILNAPEPKLD